MGDLGQDVRSLFMELGRRKRDFLGGPPHTPNINQEISNFNFYQANGLYNRARVCMGNCEFDLSGHVRGYHCFTVMNNANPTSYEQKYLGLKNSLNYVQERKIFVHPDFWGKGISDKLLSVGKETAEKYNKDLVADIISSNMRVFHFLKKHDFEIRFSWKTRKGTPMYRMGLRYKNPFSYSHISKKQWGIAS